MKKALKERKIHCVLLLTRSWRRSLSYRNQSIYLQSKSINWFLYDRDFRHERVQELLKDTGFRKGFPLYAEIMGVFQYGSYAQYSSKQHQTYKIERFAKLLLRNAPFLMFYKVLNTPLVHISIIREVCFSYLCSFKQILILFDSCSFVVLYLSCDCNQKRTAVTYMAALQDKRP